MNTIQIVSTIAIALGLLSMVPQIVAMLRRRSSAGQSVVGWGMGVSVNCSLAYVNFFGTGATTLALGNVAGAGVATAALLVVVSLRRLDESLEHIGTREVPRPTVLLDQPTEERLAWVAELPTDELATVQRFAGEEHGRRAERRRSREDGCPGREHATDEHRQAGHHHARRQGHGHETGSGPLVA